MKKKRMWREYAQIFQALSIDPSVRAIVLSAVGERAFCAGLDLSATELASVPPSPSSSGGAEGGEGQDAARRSFGLRRTIKEFQDAISAAEVCEKPVVAAIHGIAFGLAMDIACCTDVRLCAQDAKFAVKEVDIGIPLSLVPLTMLGGRGVDEEVGIAADIGTLSRLPKIVGSMSWVKDVCYSARVFGADEALRHGFVSAVLPSKAQALGEALRLAGVVADKSPLAVQSTKAIINYSVDHSVSEG